MSSFREQYGYNRLNPSSKVKRLKSIQGKPNDIKNYQKYINFNKNKTTNQYYSKNNKIIYQQMHKKQPVGIVKDIEIDP